MFRPRMNNSLRSLRSNNRGSVLPVVGLGIVAMMGATGVAVDMGRAQLVQSKLSSALDAAGLAAGASVNTVNLNSEVAKYVAANFPANYLGSTLGTVSAVASADNSTITLSASATVPTTFTKVFNVNTITVNAATEVTRASKGMELVMVLDNTGSMSGTPLSNLKTAATSLVNILYGSKTTVPNLWIGLVPFSQAVNIGSSRTGWTESDNFDWGPSPSKWAGCVDAREAGGKDVTDDPPTVALFPKYYWPDTYYGSNNWRSGSSPNYTYQSPLDDEFGPNKSCPMPITPMTSSKTIILDAIDDMEARGNTHINLGAAWGWRMLSPRWQTLWGGEMNTAGLPFAYNKPMMNKVAIIMTDGDNTIDNSNHGAYWYLDDEKLGTDSQSTAENRLNDRLLQVCSSMKTNGIIVYTIGFGSISSTAQTMLKSCASKNEYFFNSPNNTTLQAAFKTIGDSLANLRISK